MSTNAAERLAVAVKDRRRALGWSQLEVAANGGPSNTTQTTIENAKLEDLTPTTARKVDAGLGWERGSALRIWRDEGAAWLSTVGQVQAALPPTPDRLEADIAADQVFTDRVRQLQVGDASVHGLLAVVGEEVAAMARRIQDLEAELAELHAADIPETEGSDGGDTPGAGGLKRGGRRLRASEPSHLD